MKKTRSHKSDKISPESQKLLDYLVVSFAGAKPEQISFDTFGIRYTTLKNKRRFWRLVNESGMPYRRINGTDARFFPDDVAQWLEAIKQVRGLCRRVIDGLY